MWVIVKIKFNEFDIFKKELEKKLETKPLFYNPKIQVEKKSSFFEKVTNKVSALLYS